MNDIALYVRLLRPASDLTLLAQRIKIVWQVFFEFTFLLSSLDLPEFISVISSAFERLESPIRRCFRPWRPRDRTHENAARASIEWAHPAFVRRLCFFSFGKVFLRQNCAPCGNTPSWFEGYSSASGRTHPLPPPQKKTSNGLSLFLFRCSFRNSRHILQPPLLVSNFSP